MKTIRKVTLKNKWGPFTISLRKTKEGYKIYGGRQPFKIGPPIQSRTKAEIEYRKIVRHYTHRFGFKKVERKHRTKKRRRLR